MAADPTIFAQRWPNQNQNKNHPYRILIQQNKTGTGVEDRLVQIEGWLPEEVTFDVSAQYEAPYSQGLNQAIPIGGQVARALGVNLATQAMTAQVWQGSSDINFQVPIIFQAQTDAYWDVIDPIKNLLKLTMPLDPAVGGLLESPGPRIDLDKFEKSVGATIETTVPDPQRTQEILERLVGATGSLEAALRLVKKVTGAAGDFIGDLRTDTYGVLSRTSVKAVKELRKSANVGAVAFNKSIVNSIVNNISLYIGDFLYFPSIVITDVSQAYNVLMAQDNNPSRATVNVTFRTFFIPTQRDLDIMFQDRNPLQGFDV